MTDEAKLSKYLRKVTGDLRDARRRIDELERRADEPLAIVGMSCRYPGGVASPAQLWDLVAAGVDAISPLPRDRGWPPLDPDPDRAGSGSVDEGGFLDGAAEFDAGFFGIAPREALVLDPQQRLLLEVAWEALEDAGVDPGTLAGSATGVFAGTMHYGYGVGADDPELDGHRSASTAASVLSGRIAYTLGLEGPAVTLDTACSSSLVAIHLAAQSLRGGECDLALAGGATVMSDPGQFVEFSRQRALAPDGRAKPFAATADGNNWSEGVGLLVLERLADAERHGHPVLALVRGTATNQDGASNGLTAPNGPAQERVIRQALANAGLGAGDVDAVEAHGTGTPLGDPIEAGAILATYGQDREQPLRLGAIKSNIGHTQAAAGVAGVIKMALAMREGTLPRTLHLDEPTPHVDWSAGSVRLLTEAEAWEPNGHPRRAGVSSFGVSGTNAHVILEEAPAPLDAEAAAAGEAEPATPAPPELAAIPLPLAAKSGPALAAQAGRLAAHLRERPELDPADVGFSLVTTRAQLEHRAVAVGADREELLEGLDALAAGRAHGAVTRARAGRGRSAFLFPGHGAQPQGMELRLLEQSPFFAARVEACSAALEPFLDFSIAAVLRGEEGTPPLRRLDVVQCGAFTVMVSLAELWRHHGFEPDAAVGHSQGEVAAAYIAGALSLEDAALVAARRVQAIGELAGLGGMVALGCAAAEAQELIAPWGERVVLAVSNSPGSTSVSGEPDALAELVAACERRDVRARTINPEYTTHWDRVERIRERLLSDLAAIEPRAAALPLYSATHAAEVAGEEMGPEYWYRGMREPVRFDAVATAMLGAGFDRFVEPSSHPVLALALGENAEAVGAEATTIGTLRRGEATAARFTASLAEAHAHGLEVDWSRLFGSRQRLPLPTYAFQRQRYWLEPGGGAGDLGAAGLVVADHPLLAAATALPGPEGEGHLLSGRLSLREQPWLADHAAFGTALLPGTAFLELAFAAAERVGAEAVEELTVQAPLILPEDGAVRLQVLVGPPAADGTQAISVHSRREGAGEEWTTNASGRLGSDAEPARDLSEWPPRGAQALAIEDLYEQTAALGVEYGPAFQGVRAAWRRGEEVFVEAELDPEQAGTAARFGLHPALLDTAFHPGLVAEARERVGDGGPKAPFAWSGARLYRGGAERLRLAIERRGEDESRLTVADVSGQPLATVRSAVARPISPTALAGAGADPDRDALFAIEWTECGLPTSGDEVAAVVELSSEPELDAASAAAVLCAKALTALGAAIGAGDGRLAFLTRGAVAAAVGEVPDPAAAAVWGLVRSAQAEHPGRFVLIDSDGSEAAAALLPAALGPEAEAQIALRGATALAPRLARAGAGESASPTPLDPERTVLFTGGTGALGSILARHLVSEHGARHLLLVSRRGAAAPGAAELAAELEALGAEVTLAAGDVGEREQLEALLDSIPDEHPLGAVFHAAAAFDNGLVEAMSEEQLRGVLRTKAVAAWNLHELTREAELSDFVLFSSAAGSFDNPGQGNYAAANAFLDALAQQRGAAGLAAKSIAWGMWEREVGGPSELIVDTTLARLLRRGFVHMPAAQGMRLFDRSRELAAPFLIGAAIDLGVLRREAARGELAPIYGGLVRLPRRRASAPAGALAERLAAAPEAERAGIALALVAEHAAAVLGHESAGEIDPKTPFKDLGFDSLAAVELRNRLTEASGLRLPSTLVFDHPTPAAAAAFVCDLAQGQRGAPAAARVVARSEEPIAIVGMSCRFPGGIASPRDLWRLLAAGDDAIGGFPDDRGWDLERLFDPDPDRPDTSYADEGGFMRDAAEFDAAFFGVSPRDALVMDPQLRLAQEAAWEALEAAGIDPHSLRGSATGVFAGVMHHDYGLLAAAGVPASGLEGATSGGSAVSGRVAYALGLEGPAVTVDTACSSSLVAMHLAAQSLRAGECELALAGGTSVAATPGMYTMFSRQRGLAPDGRCKPFAAAADGTGVSEGVGLVLLERLSAAERDGHEVLALLRGSATNQDGASNGMTAPNGPAQERVIVQALANAGLQPHEVDAVEAHGTGTTLGDPIEAQAILATYGQERERPLRLGAIKSNLGHTQAAAGVAGVIKMALAMREGVLPQTLHVDEPTPHVDWSAGSVKLLTEAEAWEPNGHPRRAGVSSFGLSGTNAHVILEEAPAVSAPSESEAAVEGGPEPSDSPAPPAFALAVSAKTAGALPAQAERLATHLRENPKLDLADVAHSLTASRAQLDHRAVAIGADREELLGALDAIATDRPHPGAVQGRATAGKLAFLFSGQGAQRPGMGKELYDSFPVFASSLDQICAELDPHLGLSLKDHLFAKEGSKKAKRLDRTELTQPALFALEVSLYRQLQAFGLTPDYLLGHSIGELAAAHVAGVFDLSDACELIAARGALMGALPEGGAMVAIEASEGEVVTDLPAGLSIAGINSPTSVVVSGEEQTAIALAEAWKEKGRKATRLRVSHAFHSELMEPMLERFGEVASSISYAEPKLPVLSNLTGEPLTPEQATDPAYWVSQVREAVRFADGAAYLAAHEVDTLLELGPDGVLCAMAQGSFAAADKEPVAVPALRKGRPEPSALLAALGAAHANGSSFDWPSLFPGAKRVPLPTYAFQRQRYWPEPHAGAGDVATVNQNEASEPPPDAGSFARHLLAAPEEERAGLALEQVTAQVAAVLGHAEADAVDSKLPFRDLGFDSLAGVELRNRLNAAVGLPLPTTLVFDYPTPAEVAAFLCTLVEPGVATAVELDAVVERLRELLGEVGEPEREQVGARVRALLSQGSANAADADTEAAVEDRIRGASAEEILAIVNDEMGAE